MDMVMIHEKKARMSRTKRIETTRMMRSRREMALRLEMQMAPLSASVP